MGAVVHGDAAAGIAADAAPIGQPLGDAAGVLGAEGVERDQIDRADATGVDDLANRAHRWRVFIVVDGEEDAAVALRRLEHRLGVADRGRQRLLAQDVEAARHGGAGDWGVVARRCGDVDEVELLLRLHQRLRVFVDAGTGQEPPGELATGGANVSDGYDSNVATGEIGGQMALLCDEPEAYDRALATVLHDRT